MGWQDRDYARPHPPRRGGPSPGAPFGGTGRRSIVTILIVVNVAVHLLRPFSPTGTIPVPVAVRDMSAPHGVRAVVTETQDDAPFAYGAMSSGLVLRGQIWRLVTSQYLHSKTGLSHLVVNMLGLYFFGRPLERLWSRRKFLAVYTVAGLAGNIFLLLIGVIGWIHPYTPAVGASGCILGLLGICAVLFPRADVYIYGLFPVKIRTLAIVLGAWFAYTIWQRGSNYGGDACHLAGLAFGVWWAARGERWWAVRGSRTFASLTGKVVPAPRPRPGAWQRKADQRKADAELIDRLLAKVYEGGLHSLTPDERKALVEASERTRREEQQTGRVDRL